MSIIKKGFDESDEQEKSFIRHFFHTMTGLGIRLLLGLIFIPAIIIHLAITLISTTLNYLHKMLFLIINPRELLTEEDKELLDNDD